MIFTSLFVPRNLWQSSLYCIVITCKSFSTFFLNLHSFIFSPLLHLEPKNLCWPSLPSSISSLFLHLHTSIVRRICGSFELPSLRLKVCGEALERRLSVLTIEVSGTYIFYTIYFLWFVSG